jgi:tetratricopeptide (TPR) repeat protein
VRASADNFRRAVTLDSLYADGWAGLSLALALFPYFQGIPAPEVYNEVRRAATRAIALDSMTGSAHVALGLAYQHDHRWEEALSEFRTAVRLDPHDVEARVQLGRHLQSRGNYTDGLAEFLRAREDDPASALVSSWVAYGYFLQGQLDSARAEGRRALQNDSTNLTAVTNTALILLRSRDSAGARTLAARGPNFPMTYYVLAALGDREAAEARLGAMERARPLPSLAHTSRAFAALGYGDAAGALTALEAAAAAKEIWVNLYGGPTDPLFAPVRNSPRFQQLVRAAGLSLADR